MQFAGQGKPPLGVVFDSDMGVRIDNALALALLYGLEGRNESRIASVSVSRSNLKAAAFCDAVSRFYAGATNPEVRAFFRVLPVGLSTDGKLPQDTPMLTAPLARKDAGGAPVYPRGVQQISDTAEVSALIRNALTAQQDQNSVVILAGPATNLAKLLAMHGARDLISQKARFLTVVGGAYPDGPAEFNIRTDIPAAKKLFAEWPTAIVASGYEIGEALLFPASSIEKDFAWTPAHPVVDAYRAYKTMPYDAPTWDLTAVLYAVRPQEGYFKLSEPGTIRVLDDGRTQFTPSAEGKHRYLILDPAQKERIIKAYTEIASAKPVPRQPRFRLEKKEQQTPPPKPPEEKKP
jgi:inosine-uridine nucleoside N-ribohydrolase